MSEKAEIEAYRESQPRVGIDDLDVDMERVGRDIADYVIHFADGYGEDVAPTAVYVCGSFATGEATESISDLDVRVVVDSMDQFLAEEAKEGLRAYGQQIVPKGCGFLDAHIDWVPPGDDYPATCIWRFGQDKRGDGS